MNKAKIIAVSIICITSIVFYGDREIHVAAETNIQTMTKMDEAKFKQWLSRWQRNILDNVRNNYCGKEVGEDMGWVMSPMLRGYYYGYLATQNVLWVDLFASCADSWMRRSVIEPDGYPGWPKIGAAGTNVDDLDEYFTDSMLGEAMVLHYIVLMSDQILKTPLLAERFAPRAVKYIRLSEQIFEKWDKRGAWRGTARGRAITVVLPFGIDKKTDAWTEGYETRNAPGRGFSHPNNKANLIASWLLAMYDVTHKPIYQERAQKWFRLMKSRMRLESDGTFQLWSYWEPAGAWDYRGYIIPKHWIGVHPNSAYYEIDVESIVAAYEHSIVFDRQDIETLISTALVDKRPWIALAPYNNYIQREFEEHNNPDQWSGLDATPWYLAIQAGLQRAGLTR